MRTFKSAARRPSLKLKDLNKVRHRILIGDDDTPFARQLADYLTTHGFECRTVGSVSEVKDAIEFWNPDTVFIDLMLPETNALSVFKFMSTRKLRKTPQIIVMSKQALPNGIQAMRKAGASHYLVKPFPLIEAFRAVSPAAAVAAVAAASPTPTVEVKPVTPPTPAPAATPAPAPAAEQTIKELHLLNLFLKQAMTNGISEHHGLYNLMRMIGLKVHAMRCSLIRCINEETGIVLASNDDETVKGLPIHLTQYPEIREVRRTQRPLLIPNVRTSDILSSVQTHIIRTPFETLVVFPVFSRGQFFGAMSLRMQQKTPIEMHYIEKFGQVCSQIISLAITSGGPDSVVDAA